MPDHALPNHPVTTYEWLSEVAPMYVLSDPLVSPDPVGQGALHSHPATYSDEVSAAIARILRAQSFSGTILDPFAGTGGIHALEGEWRTVGVEIEPEWAACHPGTMVGDALHLDRLSLPTVDAIVTSPCYGNRMADRYRGQNDTCTACEGTGTVDAQALGIGTEVEFCISCSGSGRRPSRRYGYAMSLGRDPTEGSAAVMQWGETYRAFHRQAVVQWRGLINRQDRDRNGGQVIVIVNISDHIRRGSEQGVHLWWASMLGAIFGVSFNAEPVVTRRMRDGQNGQARATSEWLLWAHV